MSVTAKVKTPINRRKTKVSPSCSMDSDSSSLDQFMSSNESSCSSEGNDESTFMCVNSESSLDDNFDEMLYSNEAAWKKYNSPVDPQSNKGSQVNTLIKKTTLRSTSVDAVDQTTKTADENVGEADTSETISANASNPESLHMLLQEVTTHTDEELAMDISHNRTKSLLSTEPPVWHAAESTVLPPANNVTTRDTIHSTVSSDEDDDTVAVNGKKNVVITDGTKKKSSCQKIKMKFNKRLMVYALVSLGVIIKHSYLGLLSPSHS